LLYVFGLLHDFGQVDQVILARLTWNEATLVGMEELFLVNLVPDLLEDAELE
jgi:hypothetical protein